MATGYGADIFCLDGMAPGRLARGRQLLAQALYHRIITPRGTLRGGEEEAAYGIDVPGIIGSVGYDYALAALPGMIEAELKEDDRVAEVVCAVTKATGDDGSIALVLTIDVTPASAEEDFTFTMAANDVSAEFLGFKEAA